MHRGRFLVLTKQGVVNSALTPVHKNTVRNEKSERISNLKERVRIIIFWQQTHILILYSLLPAETMYKHYIENTKMDISLLQL